MASPTSRLLELLELLQTRPLTTGREIADRLGIDARTARRYVGVLQELGIPVEGQRGVGGGYRIRPGYRLPPLMLGDEEAVAVVLGLLATRGSAAGRRAGRRRRRAREDQPRPALDAPPPGRGARGDARLHLDAGRRAGRRCCRAPARGRDPPPSPPADRVPHVRGRGVGTRAQPARPRRPRGPLVPRRLRSSARRPAHVPGRPDLANRARRGSGGAAAGRLRRRRARDALACEGAVEVGGRGAARPAGRRGGAPDPGDARRARRRPRGDAAADAGRLARLDGERPRRSRLRLHDPAAGRAAGERARPRGAARRARRASRGRRRPPGAACRCAAATRREARRAAARAPS